MKYEYLVTAHRVIDGDTVECKLLCTSGVDVGFKMHARNTFEVTMRLRLARIYAAEMGTLEGEAAKAHLTELCQELFRVETFKPDKYGRWLAELYNAHNDCLNDIMVKDGHATYTKP